MSKHWAVFWATVCSTCFHLLHLLPPSISTDSPSVQQSRKVLQLLSCFYMHCLKHTPMLTSHYINSSLIFWLQRTLFLPSTPRRKVMQWLLNSSWSYDLLSRMPMSVWVKTQVHHPKALLAFTSCTNSLKGLFGKVRLFRQWLKCGSAPTSQSYWFCSDLHKIFLKSIWNGSEDRDAYLKSWAQQAGNVSGKINHIKSSLWWGDVSVKNVVLMTVGVKVGEGQSKSYWVGWTPPFIDMEGWVGLTYSVLSGTRRWS